MKIDVMVASVGHLKYVKVINDTIDEAAKARGTGIARRTDEYIADKINQGKAIIALNREADQKSCFRFVQKKVPPCKIIRFDDR